MDSFLSDEETKVSRRGFLSGAGKVAIGATILSIGALNLKANISESATGGRFLEDQTSTASGAKYPWPYTKLDPQMTAEIAYENWYKGFCAHAVLSAIIGQLQVKVGEPYSSFPYEAFAYGHGGTMGWGTICGTLFGAGIASALAGGKTGEHILNDLMAWYSDNELPVFKPSNPKAEIKNVNAGGSPLCHVSVGKWMKKEGVAFFTPERKERCARLAGDVAAQTVLLLNAAADKSYKPVYGNQAKMHQMTSQNNCTDCHGSSIPKVPGT